MYVRYRIMGQNKLKTAVLPQKLDFQAGSIFGDGAT